MKKTLTILILVMFVLSVSASAISLKTDTKQEKNKYKDTDNKIEDYLLAKYGWEKKDYKVEYKNKYSYITIYVVTYKGTEYMIIIGDKKLK